MGENNKMKQCRLCESKRIMIDEEDGYVDMDDNERIGPHLVVYYHTCEECGYSEQSVR